MQCSDNGLLCFVLLWFVCLFVLKCLCFYYLFVNFFILFFLILKCGYIFISGRDERQTQFFQAVQFACISFLLTDIHKQA